LNSRRQLGAHYTADADILKVLRGVVLDELESLDPGEVGDRVARLKLFDPACGRGDFLIVALRELERFAAGRFSAAQLVGIEIDPAAAELARASLPGATIVTGNALQIDWRELIEPDDDVIVLGNPPFLGKKEQSDAQKADMRSIWSDVRGAGVLDYATCWLRRAANYVQGTRARAAFVITSSVTQGEQVEILGGTLQRTGVELHFAHRSFGWARRHEDDARVHVVILGFVGVPTGRVRLFDYEQPEGAPIEIAATRINAYLIDGPDILLSRRVSPISTRAPAIHYGSFALDGGHFTLTPAQREAILAESPEAAPWLRDFVGGRELIHGERRGCIWLADADPAAIESIPALARAVEAVRDWRSTRPRPTTRELAGVAHRFAEIRQPTRDYLAFPTLSSERRRAIPIAFLPASTIASNQIYVIPEATIFEFGVLSSAMHMAWVRTVGGRLESRHRYSAQIVYNNFPWPDDADEVDRVAVCEAGQAVLDVRAGYPEMNLAALYDPHTMPALLGRAHDDLDRAVERCYADGPFVDDRDRAEHLFARRRPFEA
jgi:predicted RNA methylase